ncbi:MAG: hypothetical protein ACOYMG_28590 [Candidatus Methylumidiphilus sp.]
MSEPAPSSAQLNEAFKVYLDAYHASLTRDTLKIRQRDTARQTLTNLLKHLASYLEVIAHLDTDKLSTTGYNLRKDIVRGIHGGILPASADFKISLGTKSGTLVLHVARLARAKSIFRGQSGAARSLRLRSGQAPAPPTAPHLKIL